MRKRKQTKPRKRPSLIGRIKLKLLQWLMRDLCKRHDCDHCFFSEMYMDKPVYCTRRDAALFDEAKRAWNTEKPNTI